MSDHLLNVTDWGYIGHRVDCPCEWANPAFSRIVWTPKAAQKRGLMPAGKITFATGPLSAVSDPERPRRRG